MENSGKTDGRVGVAVVDDDENLRMCLKDVLHSGTDFILAGEFCNGKEALKAVPGLCPEIALMDIRLPGMDGIECAKQLRHFLPRLKIIIMSGNRDRNSFTRALGIGALAYIVKPLDMDQLLVNLHFAAAQTFGTGPFQNTGNNQVFKNTIVTRNFSLSPREKDVLSGLAEGLLYKEISDKLGISFSAVHKYSHNIYKKLGAANRSEAVRFWHCR